MTERPILFNAPMVRATLSGTKTQTRRVISEHHLQQIDTSNGRRTANWSKPMPYGRPGERLWVREATIKVEDHGYEGPVYVESEDGRACLEGGLAPDPDDCVEVEPCELRIRPSIHMPRAYCRITLEITGVRVERLQDISEEDALAEGVFKKVGRHGPYDAVETATDDLLIYASPTQAREAFQRLWSQMSGPESWHANPWVWVLEFKRV